MTSLDGIRGGIVTGALLVGRQEGLEDCMQDLKVGPTIGCSTDVFLEP